MPHIGWNKIQFRSKSDLHTGVVDGSYVYFNHGFTCQPADEGAVLATTEYGEPFASIVGSGQVFGFQFHPEKSQRVGLQLLRNFISLEAR